ncbi:MAG: hypothetical protein PHX57_09800 [Desulfobulbaceae bacterium]|jgi:hypothetical protein|nr:hypothetical protein [Desulfobulbaceae bacterium]
MKFFTLGRWFVLRGEVMQDKKKHNIEKDGNPESGCRLVQARPVAAAQGNL